MSEENKDTVFIGLEKVPLKSEREEKKKKIKRIIGVILLCVLLAIGGFYIGLFYGAKLHPVNKFDSANGFGEISAMLDRYWIYSSEHENLKKELEDKAFYGMTTFDEDPYTTYMSDEELKEFADSINMNFVGIGVVYSMTGESAIIQRVLPDSPAEKAKLAVGDIIDKVDGISVHGLESDKIKELVVGEKGTTVTITVIRNNETLDIDIVRDEVDNSVYCYSENDYIVMQLSSFGMSTGKDCEKYLDKYSNYDKIIIDIRDNTGGYQTSVKEIAGLFVGNGKVYLRQKDASGYETADLTSCDKTFNFKKIVILVNENTASAAEVFAICLREQLNNVTLVGETTYGKGVIQSTHYLNNGGVLKFSSFYWYSPNGVSIHKTGIVPDIIIKRHKIASEEYVDISNEVYKLDNVSDAIKLSELGLDYLGYEIDRMDGYFDISFENALKQYQFDNNLTIDGKLDKKVYESIISDVVVKLSDLKCDEQYLKAIELIEQ